MIAPIAERGFGKVGELRNVQPVRLGPAVEKRLGENPAYMEAMVQDDQRCGSSGGRQLPWRGTLYKCTLV